MQEPSRAPEARVIKPRTTEALFEFHRLGDERFEEVCCHLLYNEPELEGAELYGRPRQRQFGVDATEAPRRC